MGTSWGRWDEWDDTAFETQGSKFEPWRSEAEDATSQSRRFPTILNQYNRGEKKLEGQSGVWAHNLRLFEQAALTTAAGPPPSPGVTWEYVGLYTLCCDDVCMHTWVDYTHSMGGGPGLVVSTAASQARVRGSIPGLGGLKETKMFRILCLEHSFISIISPSSGGSL